MVAIFLAGNYCASYIGRGSKFVEFAVFYVTGEKKMGWNKTIVTRASKPAMCANMFLLQRLNSPGVNPSKY